MVAFDAHTDTHSVADAAFFTSCRLAPSLLRNLRNASRLWIWTVMDSSRRRSLRSPCALSVRKSMVLFESVSRPLSRLPFVLAYALMAGIVWCGGVHDARSMFSWHFRGVVVSMNGQ